MSKKLLIAVLAFGFFALSGAVIGYDDGNLPARSYDKTTKVVEELTFDEDIRISDQYQPTLTTKLVPDHGVTPSKYFPPDYYCDFVDPTASTYGEWWPVPWDSDGDGTWATQNFINRDFVYNEGYTCTLYTVYVGIDPEVYWEDEEDPPNQFPYMTGDPDMTVTVVRGGSLGAPDIVGSVTVPYASLPTTQGYASVDVSTIDGGNPLVLAHEDRVSIWISNPDGTGASALIITSTGYMAGPVPDGGEMIFDYHGTGFQWYGPGSFSLNVAYDFCCGDVPFSECYTETLNCSLTWGYYLPDSGPYARNQQCMLIQHNGRDTLVSVDLFIGGLLGTPDLAAFVYPDDGLGQPDTANPLWSTTVLNADLVAALGDWVNIGPMNIVMEPTDNYWVGFTPNWATWADGDTVIIVTDDSEEECAYGGRYYTLCGYFGPECYFVYSNRSIVMDVTICPDEFDLCRFLGRVDDICEPYYVTPLRWYFPAYVSSIEGLYKPLPTQSLSCRLEQIRVGFVPRTGTAEYNADVYIYEADGPGGWLPGTLLGHKEILAADINDYSAGGVYTVVDVSDLNIRTNTALWVGAESQAPLTNVGDDAWDISIQQDDDVCGNIDGTVTLWSDGWYGNYNCTFMDAWSCCIRPPERECGPPDDWAMGAHDALRTAASNNSTGDAKNSQDMLWYDFQGHPVTPGVFMGTHGAPIIYDTVAMVGFGDRLVAYGINGDGAGGPNRMWEISGEPFIGLNFFMNRPLAKDGKVYFGGSSFRSMQCADVYTGDTLWSRNPYNPLDPNGPTDYTCPLILTMEYEEVEVDVLYFTTSNGLLYALNAADGVEYPGWDPLNGGAGNPVYLQGDPKATLSSNGVDVLYVGDDGTQTTELYGTMYAIDAATGAELWRLEEADLMGHEIDEDTLEELTQEIFQGPLSVDPADGSIYCMTGFNGELYGRPTGVVYKISPLGNIEWGVEGRVPRFTGMVIDAPQVLYTSLTRAYDEFEGVWSLDKFTGDHIWEQDTMLFQTINWVEGALDCRPLAPDMYYQPNMDNRLTVINSETGEVEFEYTYFDTLSDRGAGTAIGPDHVVMTNRSGDVFCFTIMDPRPRARFLKYDQYEVVEPLQTAVNHEEFLMNNGGADLVGEIVSVDEEAPDSVLVDSPKAIDPDRLGRLTSMADAMSGFDEMRPVKWSSRENETIVTGLDVSEYSGTKAAYSVPPGWFVALVTTSFTIAPGDALDLEYTVDPDLVTRGPHTLFVSFDFTNEQYFLNSPDRHVIINYGVLGGCMEQHDVMYFGDAGENEGPVFNHCMLADQAGSAHWDIDGNDAAYYQGAMFYAAGTLRLATNCDSWHAEDNSDFWNSILPDANLDLSCGPDQVDMVLGRIWDDSKAGYVDVNGHIFHYAYIDSVINFNCEGTGWEWDNIDCEYDNDLTIGIKVYEWAYGAEHELLGNFVIRKHIITNRNDRTVNDVGFGSMNDYDLESNRGDICRLYADRAIAACQSCAFDDATWVWGQGTIPYDAPGETEKLYLTRSLDAQQAAFDDDYVFMDSIYYWLRNERGETYQVGVSPDIPCLGPGNQSDDREVFMGFDYRSYGPYEQAVVGTYFYGFNSLNVDDDSLFIKDYALLINQWAGFGRGDINQDNEIDLSDLVALYNLLYASGDGPLFEHLADVDGSGVLDGGDMTYFVNYWFGTGPAPVGDWVLPEVPAMP
jgi:hypothetical protein